MRLRSRTVTDEAFDGLTAEEIRRIRGGLEGLRSHSESKSSRAGDRTTVTESAKNKRGRRA